jgi:two-component system, response regulator PdtaR
LSCSGDIQPTAASRPDIALVDLNLRDGRSTAIDVARWLQENGTQCLFIRGDGGARRHRDAALGLLEKLFASETVVTSVAAADAIQRGEKPRALPRELELFASADGSRETLHWF